MVDTYRIERRDGKKGYLVRDGVIAMSWGNWKDKLQTHPPFKANKRMYGR